MCESLSSKSADDAILSIFYLSSFLCYTALDFAIFLMSSLPYLSASSTGIFLKNSGALYYGQIAWDTTRENYQKAYK
jgi:hypothetical protein